MTGPLAGLKVLDLTQVLAGPYCTMLLADMGAEVIKVEAPAGDEVRRFGGATEGTSAPFRNVNRNKRGIVVNLKAPEGADLVRRLAAQADVLVENFRPGVMERLGLGYRTLAALNHGLIYCSISGFGQTGPYSQRGGYDLIAQGMSGIMSVTGPEDGPPAKVGVPITDLGGAMFATYAILAAYAHKLKTGEGQQIDAALLDAGVAFTVWESAEYWTTGRVPGRLGSAHRLSAPYQAFRTANGYLNIGANNQKLFEKLVAVLELNELTADARFATPAARLKHRAALATEIEARLGERNRDYWLELLDAAGIPSGPIYTMDQVFADPQVQARGMVQMVEGHPALGIPVKLSRTPGTIRRAAPALGADTEAVLAELGFSPAAVAALREQGIIGGESHSGK